MRRFYYSISVAVLCMATVVGCVGYVDDGGGAVIVAPPPPTGVVIFGGDYDRGRDVHVYSHRGYESRHPAPAHYQHHN